jgi:hypothetical protein
MWHDDSGKGCITFPRRNAVTGAPYKAVSFVGGFKNCTYDGLGEMRWRDGRTWKGMWIASEMQIQQGAWGKTDPIE